MPLKKDFELGGIVGYCEMTDCVSSSDSKWFDGSGYGFVVKNAKPIPFIPMNGALSFFKSNI
jgi:hypothetical protein